VFLLKEQNFLPLIFNSLQREMSRLDPSNKASSSSERYEDISDGKMVIDMIGGHGMKAVSGTGAPPPTPTSYEYLQPACDVCFALDGISFDESRNESTGATGTVIKSCNPTMSVNPPAFAIQKNGRYSMQRKTWGVSLI
jgi:hypothetical protein